MYMKIPESFYQFKNERALIIISGTKRAELFACSDGEMKKLEPVFSEKIKYSDKEGSYIGKSGLFRGGSLLDDVNKKETTRFLELLGKRYDEIKGNKYDFIAVMAPKEAINEVIDSLGIPKKESKRKIRIIKEGNFLHYSGEELLNLLSDSLGPIAG